MNSNQLNPKKSFPEILLNLSGTVLTIAVSTSTLIFGLYILFFYAIALFNGETDQWNEILPGLYDDSNRTSTIGIGIHFITGGIILILGCIQLFEGVRKRFPVFHRWVGRIYVLASIITALGGLIFILMKGTIGGWVMDIGFGLYGILMLITAIETIRHARAARFDKHRAWALRLFALAIGSWLYRMDYGFWLLLADGYGHLDNFHGPFDKFMSFFFYIPNLIIAEIFIGKSNLFKSSLAKVLASILLFFATGIIILGSYFFTKHLWGPEIIEGLTF